MIDFALVSALIAFLVACAAILYIHYKAVVKVTTGAQVAAVSANVAAVTATNAAAVATGGAPAPVPASQLRMEIIAKVESEFAALIASIKAEIAKL